MVRRYAHLSQEHKRQAIEPLANNSPAVFTNAGESASAPETRNIKAVNSLGR